MCSQRRAAGPPSVECALRAQSGTARIAHSTEKAEGPGRRWHRGVATHLVECALRAVSMRRVLHTRPRGSMRGTASGTAYDVAHELGPAGARAPARGPGRRLPPEPPHRRAGSRWLGWAGTALLHAVGGIMRFWHVGAPHQLIFDETYYVKQGWSMVLFWFEMKNDDLLQEAQAGRPALHRERPVHLRHRGRLRRAPAGRQVADRLGRDAVRHPQLLRLALLGRAGRHALDPHARPHRAAALPLRPARHGRGGAAGLRGPPLRPLAHRAARHLRHVLRARRVRGAAHRPRPAREVLARAVGDRPRAATSYLGAVARLAAVALGSRRHARPVRPA